jgi:hypothetical protein
MVLVAQTRKVNLGRLKRFALESLPDRSILRALLLEEPDELSLDIFLAKLDIWLRLSRIEKAAWRVRRA